jgi:PAS domain-containing protein
MEEKNYSKEELLQSQFLDFVHEDDKEATLKELIKLGSGDTTLNFTNRYRTKSGTYKNLNWRAEPDGQFINCIARDITEELEAKQLFEESQERFIASLEGSLEAIYFLDCVYDNNGEVVDFKIKESNSNACKQLSMSREQLINQNICELFPINKTNGYFEKYKNCYLTQIAYEEEYFIPEENIASGWYYHQVIPLKNGIAIYNKDISETKKSIVELQETKEILEETNKIARIGYWEVDLVKGKIFWSKILFTNLLEMSFWFGIGLVIIIQRDFWPLKKLWVTGKFLYLIWAEPIPFINGIIHYQVMTTISHYPKNR